MPIFVGGGGGGGAGSASDYFNDVRRGLVPGASAEVVIGNNESVGTSVESVWEEGGIYVFPAAAVQMTLSSDDADDTAAGTGARTVLLSYLDGSYVEQTEIITLNGTTAVNTVATDILRIRSLIVVTAGSSLENEGTVYVGTGSITAGKPANVFGLIEATENSSHMGFYTVPEGKNAFIVLVQGSVETGKFVHTDLVSRVEGGLFLVTGSLVIPAAAINFPSLLGSAFPEHTDLDYRVEADNGTADVHITTEYLLIDN